MLINHEKPAYNRLFKALSITALAAISSVSMTAMAIDGKQSDSDPDAPIAALENLDSLKTVQPLEFNMPTVQRFETTNGVPVSFVRTTELPIFDVDISFNAGSARDDTVRQNGYGIANMAATLLNSGTQTLDEEAFTQQVEQLGLGLTVKAYKDMFKVNLRSLSDPKYIVASTQLLQDMLSNPAWDKAVLERKKAQLLSDLQQNLQYPGYVADMTFMQELYGNHPYAHPSTGTVDTVPSITREDLVKFQDKFLVAKNANITITGDLTTSEAKALADKLTASLKVGQKPAPLPKPMPLATSRRINVPFDSAQTTVMMGQIGGKRTSNPVEIQKQTNFEIGQSALGGNGFGSRLMKEVRRNKGYTYGIYGRMSNMQTNGPYVIKFSAREDVVEDAIDATLDIVNDTLDNGITPKEFRLTKEKFVNSYPMDFASNKDINGMIATTTFYDLPDNYLDDYFARLDKATLQDVNTELKNTLKPENFLIVTVGQ